MDSVFCVVQTEPKTILSATHFTLPSTWWKTREGNVLTSIRSRQFQEIGIPRLETHLLNIVTKLCAWIGSDSAPSAAKVNAFTSDQRQFGRIYLLNFSRFVPSKQKYIQLRLEKFTRCVRSAWTILCMTFPSPLTNIESAYRLPGYSLSVEEWKIHSHVRVVTFWPFWGWN